MSKDIKSCPFCEHAADVQSHFGRDFWVQCKNLACGSTDGTHHQHAGDAIKHWNRRPAQAPSAPVDVCAQMRALCSACGGTGDVTSIVGEWLGSCDCPASAPVAPDLTPVIHWLEGGCDPLQAAKELRSYQRNLGQLEAPEIAVVAHVDASASADPVVELNVALLRSRSAVGTEKYGTTLAAAALPLRAWLDHALQESLDQANYLQAAMQTIDGAALAGETPP